MLKYSGRLPVSLLNGKPLGREEMMKKEQEKWKVEMEGIGLYIRVILVSVARVFGIVPERLRSAKPLYTKT